MRERKANSLNSRTVRRSAAGLRAGQAASVHSRTAYWVGRLDRALRRRLGSAVRRFGITIAQYTALSVLQSRGPLSNAQLARRSLVSPQAMNEIVKIMAAKRLVTRRIDPAHARVVLMGLTRRGAELLRRCEAAVQRAEQGMLGPLSHAEREQLRLLLRQCVARLEEGH